MLLKKAAFTAAAVLAVALVGGAGGLACLARAAGDSPKRAGGPPAAGKPTADVPKDKPQADADAEKIQGTWVAVSAEMGGKPAPGEAIKDLSLVITADTVAFNPDGENRKSKYKLDPTKTPKVIELTPLDGPAKGKTVRGLYELDGDRLKLCVQNGPGEEPKEFATKPDTDLRLLILKRKPAEEKPKEDKPKDDLPALQGAWKVVSVEIGGKEATVGLADQERKAEWVVKDRFIRLQSEDPAFPVLSEVFAVRPNKNSKEIDINPYPVGLFVESDVDPGIYTLDGDVWKVCLATWPMLHGNEGRPKEMATKEGDDKMVLITLKRVRGDAGALPGDKPKPSAQDAPAPPGKADEKEQKLLREWAETANRAFGLRRAEYVMGKASLESVAGAARRLLAADLERSAAKVDRVAALEVNRDRLAELEEMAKKQLKAGMASPSDVADAEYYRIEAEILLEREKAK